MKSMSADPQKIEKMRSTFSYDHPIKGSGDDRLGRANYARAIADATVAWNDEDSLVIGVYGKWGSGKTSIKNMILERIKESAKIDIIEFNPWQYSGQKQVYDAFFKEIGIALGKKFEGKDGKRLIARWKFYAASLRMGSSLFGPIKWLLSGIFMLIAVLAFGSSFFSFEYIRYAPWIISIVFGILATVSGFSDQVVQWLTAKSEVNIKSTSEIKEELVSILQKRKQPLLIVIDDIDRLTPQEIRLLFQLIKVNCDLPRLVYIVLAQRDVVEGSLEVPNVVSGKAYLEKIVQIPFDVPLIEQSRLEKIFFQGLDEILGKKILEKFDSSRWANIYVPGLKDYFTSLRQVNRYLSSLAFHVGLFKNGGTFEVNPVDLIALETMRLREPEVYGRIPVLKHVLLERRGKGSYLGIDENEAKKMIQNLILLADTDHQQNLTEIIKELFPLTEPYLKNSSWTSSYDEAWDRSRVHEYPVNPSRQQQAISLRRPPRWSSIH